MPTEATFLWMIWFRTSGPRSLGSWRIRGTKESTLVTDSSVPLMNYDLSDPGSLILIQITPKERSAKADIATKCLICTLAVISLITET